MSVFRPPSADIGPVGAQELPGTDLEGGRQLVQAIQAQGALSALDGADQRSRHAALARQVGLAPARAEPELAQVLTQDLATGGLSPGRLLDVFGYGAGHLAAP